MARLIPGDYSFYDFYEGGSPLQVFPEEIDVLDLNQPFDFGLSGAFASSASQSFTVDTHIKDVCCCRDCSNEFDPMDNSTTDPSEIQSSIPADVTTTASITVGVPRQEGIDFAGDRDWFAVTLTEGQTYTISLAGTTHSTYIALTDAIVSLYNAEGVLIGTDDDGGSHTSILNYADGFMTFTAGETGIYYVEADGFGSLTGGYTVEVDTRASDGIANGPATTATHAIGATTIGAVDYNADQDWYAVELEAGETYEFLLDGEGSNTLGDGYLTFHDSTGALLFIDDDSGPGNFGSRIVWTAETSGTYYVSAQGFTGNQAPSTGTYTLTSGLTDPLSPMEAIDWGTQLPGNTVTVYFANAGETFDGETSAGWLQWEQDAAMAALNDISNYVDINFEVTTDSANATFKLVTIETADFLGSFGPPGTSGAGVGVFVRDGVGWSESGVQKGGFGYVTLIHEFGHGLGLAHPHDGGGVSSVMLGVTGSQDRGNFDLNQGIYTTMSYVDGWNASPYGTSGVASYGWQATMMALDLAVLQAKYGATERNTGDTVYELSDINSPGTYWEAIWDTGGIDTLTYSGFQDATLDLRAATLQYGEGGGGFVTYADTIHGGFTIANGVVIENAIGSVGDDTIISNEFDNILTGDSGADVFVFANANGDDTITDFDATVDTIDLTALTPEAGQAVFDSAAQIGSDTILTLPEGGRVTLTGVTATELSTNNFRFAVDDNGPIIGGSSNDLLTGTEEADLISGLAGNDILIGLGGSDTLLGGDGNDRLNGGDAPEVSATEAFVYRLYLSTLGREPDQGGLQGWVNVLDAGVNTQADVAAGFVTSTEFQNTYGALDNAGFVELLYNNVLNRSSDPAGLQGWLDALAAGTTRAEVVLGFTNSPEFITNTEFPALAYFTAIDEAHLGQVYRAYGAVLDRTPDAVGFLGWVSQLDTDALTLQQVIDGFTGSQEFQTVYGDLTDTEFVTLLYQNVLNRSPDAVGLQGWLDLLSSGTSRAEVVLGFSESGEYITGTQAGLEAFIPTVLVDSADILDGGTGNDELFGGRGQDTFIFNGNEDGVSTVHGFDDFDILQLNGFGYADASAATAFLTQSGSDVLFDDQGVTITISNALVADVAAAIAVPLTSGSSTRDAAGDTLSILLPEDDQVSAELLFYSSGPEQRMTMEDGLLVFVSPFIDADPFIV